MRIEHEIKLLQEDKKQLFSEFKDTIDPRVFKSALNAAKSRSKLNSGGRDDYDEILSVLEDHMRVEHIE